MQSQANPLKAIGLGLLVALALSAIMVPLTIVGIPPFPQPPSLAFAEVVFGTTLPLPIGLLFHLVYVTFWSAIYLIYFSNPNTFGKTSLLAGFLWLIVLLVFFPIIGWGVAGLQVGVPVLVASLGPHLLFAIFLWVAGKYV